MGVDPGSPEILRESARFTSQLRVEVFPAADASETNFRHFGEEGFLQNISRGGACVVTASPLQVSDLLKISFPIQQFISTPRTVAEVKWTSHGEDGKYISGLRFLI